MFDILTAAVVPEAAYNKEPREKGRRVLICANDSIAQISAVFAALLRRKFRATFVGFGMSDRAELTRIGVLDKDGNPRESVIDTLAAAYAADFMKNCVEKYGDDDEGEIFFIYDTLNELWSKDNVLASYLYLILRGGVFDACSIRREIYLTARREDLLRLFISCFVKVFNALINEYEDTLDNNE